MKRSCGILLPVAALPSRFGIGDFGPSAFAFVDRLIACEQSYWQILPLNPTDPAFGNSPYSSVSAFAGSPLYISPDFLVRDGFLETADIQNIPQFSADVVAYEDVKKFKDTLLESVVGRGIAQNSVRYKEFCQKHAGWLDDFAFFVAYKETVNCQCWNTWNATIRNRDDEACGRVRVQLRTQIERKKVEQFLFYSQWTALKSYANSKGVRIIGDVPIYVTLDSADAWAHSELFKLDAEKKPSVVAGVPPDYFCSTGQLWGNPVYDWDTLKKDRYAWWLQRFGQAFSLYDVIRLDHFRGFVGFWEVPAVETTAVKGKWVPAPAQDFFSTVMKQFPQAAIIAEDLGVITDDVVAVLDSFKFPRMKVLLFAFGESMPGNAYMPHNYDDTNFVVYTGTHDNNTVRGWFEKESTVDDRKRLSQFFGHVVSVTDVNRFFVHLALSSTAVLSVVPLQDVLGLGQEARINVPATATKNWQWRVSESMLETMPDWFKDMVSATGRALSKIDKKNT